MNENAKFELRNLTADDIFPMFKIISKIGIREFKSCFDTPEVKKAVANIASGGADADLNAVGVTVAIDIAGLLIGHLPDCKDDIYFFLAQLSGMTKDEIAALPMATFIDMIVAVVKKEEFKDFFQAVAKLFK